MAEELRFSLNMDTQGLTTGITRARDAMSSGMKQISDATLRESGRISQALANIKGLEAFSTQTEQARQGLAQIRTEAGRLGNAWQQSKSEMDRMVGSIERIKQRVSELNAIPKKKPCLSGCLPKWLIMLKSSLGSPDHARIPFKFINIIKEVMHGYAGNALLPMVLASNRIGKEKTDG